MDGKKSFFEMLEPKSALVVGVVAGVLLIGTIGFIILGASVLSGKIGSNTQAKGNDTEKVAISNTNPARTPVVNVVKSDRPKVELFVMSYCPFGLQMEKAYLPAWNLLKNKADFSIKFVDYAMHGLKELEENTRQYCIQKEQSAKYVSYLQCFTGKDDYKACLTSTGVNTSKLDSCVSNTNKQFAIIDKYYDQSTWISGQFPQYPIDADLNQQYGVQGSPTLVINGAEVSANRTPEAVKQAICSSFTNAPSECQTKLSDQSTSSGFGTGVGTNSGSAECGS